MHNFDTENSDFDHHFVKTNSTMLKRLFDTTDVVPLWIADMDFKVAEPINEEIRRLADRGVFAYEFPNHLVYKEICKWFQKRHRLELKSRWFIQVPSVLAAIALLIR